MSLSTLAAMPCNPAVGGLAKGQLVREIDALGGEMGKIIDATGIQFRMLNASKGPAVRSPRAQADKALYSAHMTQSLIAQPGLTILADRVESLVIVDTDAGGKRVKGVLTQTGRRLEARSVILTTGTFLRGLIHIGESQHSAGRGGERAAVHLTGSLMGTGLALGRLKTGTPPRVARATVDFTTLAEQPGDAQPQPFSFTTERITTEQIPCHITYTNETTHGILRENLHRAPMYSGQIHGTGPRYCPSIEDKVVRFEHKESHQIFLEPEGRHSQEIYLNGISTSTPRDVQEEFVHTLAGLERAKIVRFGYAIEYDYVEPTQLRASLEVRSVERLFLAGQINGTSGYEEAAAQGIIAGINAARSAAGDTPLVLGRDEAYIGVLIDDLVTQGTTEPYRMFTSRAEYRLVLRHDNADRRLTPRGYAMGLIDRARHAAVKRKEAQIQQGLEHLNRTREGSKTLAERLRRPEIVIAQILASDPAFAAFGFSPAVLEQIEIEAKYASYFERQAAMIESFQRMESAAIPESVDYTGIEHLRLEAREKLTQIRPASIGQAARISGVSPADISVLMVYLKKQTAASA